MNRKNLARVLSLVLLLAMIATSASAATLTQLLKYAKGQGFTVKTKSTTVTKATLAYSESTKKADTLTWTGTSKKSYSISASKASAKTKLRELYVYLANNYKWKSCTYKLNGTIEIGFNASKAKKSYKTLAAFRTGAKKYVAARKTTTGNTYVLNTKTKKFHLPGCKDIDKMSEQNKKTVTATRASVISDGYSPCGHCKP